ncbi:hypothetical protein [Caballeronia arationis]|uniref:hypothetical protein n=1 Tax=Caballeronia arationis TaxID=1777142 RepID=UPI000AEA8036|nr:hypothetical protein [Caballeronia arationis]
MLEQRIAGLASFGSAYGGSVGESRLCLRHDRLTACNTLQKSFVVEPFPEA